MLKSNNVQIIPTPIWLYISLLGSIAKTKIRIPKIKNTIISSVLVATDKRPEVKIDWRIYTKNPDEPLIRDLIIEGLSLARTLKEEFNSIIQSNDGNIYALFTNLKEFINK